MNKATAVIVRERAAGRCEYCRSIEAFSPLKFQIEHIIARQHHGSDAADNLALACGFCNLHKGPNLAGIDPSTGMITQLFHPRQHAWSEHFIWDGPYIRGISSHGRASVAVLAMNAPEQVAIRELLDKMGLLKAPS